MVKWYVGASFAVQPDFKSLTGAIMTTGQRVMQSVYRKHKLNPKIIIEVGLVAVDDTSAYILWTVLFIEWQGYNIDKNIFHHDNKSTILMEVNGKRVAGNRRQELNI